MSAQRREARAETPVDVLVVGGGMVGATLACLLARAGFSVSVVDATAPPVFNPDAPIGLRVSALAPGAISVLRAAGAWNFVERERHRDYRRMWVEDRMSGALVEFNAAEFGLERLGTLVENDLLLDALRRSLDVLPGVRIHCPARLESYQLNEDRPGVTLQGGLAIRARLVAAADGAESEVRRALGIGCQYWTYGQQGIVAQVRTAHENPGLAWQRFLPGGPLAFLPMPDGSSSIVWSCRDAEAKRLLELTGEAFAEELQFACRYPEGIEMPGTGGFEHEAAREGPFSAILTCGPRAAFPLNLQLAESYVSGKAVLVGDSAHVVHPLAGQGVNIGLLDAAALTEALIAERQAGNEFASVRTLEAYARARRSEAEIMARGIHALRSLFAPELLGPLRRLGMGLVNRSWYAREIFVRRAAGLDHNAPALARGADLATLLR